MGKYIPVDPEKWGEMVKAMAENARLKADVERLTLLQVETLNERNKAEAEVERLRKAGDAMHEELGNFAMTWPLRDAWNAAKEGKPSV